jgi:hypothetical protein
VRIETVSRDAIVLSEVDPALSAVSVRLDGHRVWTVPLDGVPAPRLAWPAALASRLEGRTRVSIEDPASGRALTEADALFDEQDVRTGIVDRHGRWLAVNKWGRLIRTLEGDGAADLRARMLVNGSELVLLLREWGLEPFVIGGSLLGTIRDGRLLPHDDDLDLTVVWEVDDAVEVIVAHRRLEDRLTRHGYTVVRHSHAHLQITFQHDDGAIDHYVDIFATFFIRDVFSQPFPFRNRALTRADLLPVSAIVVEGVELPAPASPERWLEMAYGVEWRVPDPSFSFDTPSSTTRRFDAWFGVFNGGRDHWERVFEEAPCLADALVTRPALASVLQGLPEGTLAIDIGCGDGASTAMLAARIERVVGLDYSLEAIAAARSRSLANARFEFWNVHDGLDRLTLTARVLRSGRHWLLHLGGLLHQIGREHRVELLGMIADLGASVTVYADFPVELPERFDHEDPSSWHLPVEVLQEETARRGLTLEVLGMDQRADEAGERAWSAVRLLAPTRGSEL